MQTNNMVLETENTGKIIENKKDNKNKTNKLIKEGAIPIIQEDDVESIIKT